MRAPRALLPDEKIIAAIACLIAIVYFVFAPKSCQPGATALNIRNFNSTEQSQNLEKNNIATVAPLPSEATSSEEQFEQSKPSSYTATKATSSPQTSSTVEQSTLASVPENSSKPSSLGTELALTKEPVEEQNKTTPDESALLALSLTEKQEQITSLSQKTTEQEAELARINSLKDEALAQLDNEQRIRQEETQTLEGEVAELKAQLAGLQETLRTNEIEKEARLAEEKAKQAVANIPEAQPQSEETPATASSFAKSEEDLDEARKTLVLAVRDMEPLRDDALNERYEEISETLNATSLARINFASGSSALSPDEAQKIIDLKAIAAEESVFLVTGFADTSGSAASNSDLSSARSKVAANFLGQHIGFQRVSAIYLGQTARFGPRAKNRVVEIWELKGSTP